MNANDVSDRGLDVLSHNLVNLRAIGVAGADITDDGLERLVDARRETLRVVDVLGCRGLSRAARQAAHGGEPLQIRAAIRKERGETVSDEDDDDEEEEEHLVPRRRAAARAVDRFEEMLDSDDDANENWIDEEENENEEEENENEEEYEEEEDAVPVPPAAAAAPQTGALKIVMRRR